MQDAWLKASISTALAPMKGNLNATSYSIHLQLCVNNQLDKEMVFPV